MGLSEHAAAPCSCKNVESAGYAQLVDFEVVSARKSAVVAKIMSTAEVVLHETSLWQNRRCLIMACVVATANMQYGFDSAAIGALQAMPGFLKVFGYPDPSSPLGYGIDVCVRSCIEDDPLRRNRALYNS